MWMFEPLVASGKLHIYVPDLPYQGLPTQQNLASALTMAIGHVRWQRCQQGEPQVQTCFPPAS
jgi:hypothetical protein